MRLIIDQGTSSTKAFLFNSNGKIVYQDKIKHDLYRPSRNHVECNASEILNACMALIIKSIKTSTDQILSMGLSVQRSTFLFWDRKNDSGKIVSDGIYFIEMKGQNKRIVEKVTLLKSSD